MDERFILVNKNLSDGRVYMEPDDQGDWVRLSDLAAARAEIERLKRLCDDHASSLIKADAEIERRGRELNLAKYGEPDFSWSIHKEAMSELLARAEKAEAERDEARAQVAAHDDIIGSWLSAALEDPTAGAEFKADVKRWFETGHHEALEAYGREKVEQALDAANIYMIAQYGLAALGHPLDRQRILAEMEKLK